MTVIRSSKVADSTQNRSAIDAWKRQPELNRDIAERDRLQKQLEKVLSGPYSESAEKQANELYGQIAAMNKTIGTKQSRSKKKQG